LCPQKNKKGQDISGAWGREQNESVSEKGREKLFTDEKRGSWTFLKENGPLNVQASFVGEAEQAPREGKTAN